MDIRTGQVIELLKAIETGANEPVGVINPQNTSNITSVSATVSPDLARSSRSSHKDPRRSIPFARSGRAISCSRTRINFFGPKIGFDVFRFENGQIVEHWDNLQETAPPNPSGHTMIDGARDMQDLDKTDANKALVRAFVDDILVNGRMDKLAGYFDGDNYIQHNPMIGDRLSGLSTALSAMAKQGITLTYDRIHTVLGEGNFVLVVSEGNFGGKHSSFYDLFRVERGRLPSTGTPLRRSRRATRGKTRTASSGSRHAESCLAVTPN